MVRDAENPSLREASCCRVEVVNGGAGLRRRCVPSPEFFNNPAQVHSAVEFDLFRFCDTLRARSCDQSISIEIDQVHFCKAAYELREIDVIAVASTQQTDSRRSGIGQRIRQIQQ